MTRRINPPMTAGESRAYMRGYNRGRKRMYDYVRRIRDVAVAWRTKSRDGWTQTARCDGCALWRRGGDERTKWGYCSQSWEDSPDHLGCAWGQAEDYRVKAQMVTHENFACINWRPPMVHAADPADFAEATP